MIPLRQRARCAVVGLCILALGGCTTFRTHQALAPNVDLSRYAGRWYIIANIPYFAEAGKVGSYFDVSFPGGRVRDVYVGRAGGFAAEPSRFTMHGYVVPGTGNAYWRESPFWPVYLSYLILYVGPDYGTALVGYPGRGYGWVLSRHRRMDDATYQAMLARFAQAGYPIAQFRRVPQFPNQIGKPGFAKP
ncbi:MAG: lipocalin family protein [Rhodospirillales bacterium]|nr:lipocalin family protein [Rhodospirillales bacterium]